jgi:hypothetical protein
MRFRAGDLHPHGWAPPQTLYVPDWCGCTTEYLPVPVGQGKRGNASLPVLKRLAKALGVPVSELLA